MTAVAWLAPDRARAAAEVGEAVGRVAALVRGLPAAAVAAPAVGHWSVRDVAVHLAWGMRLYTGLLAGTRQAAESLALSADLSEEGIAADPERDPDALARALLDALPAYLAAAADAPPGTHATWHGGLRLPVPSLLALTLGEALVHGRDIAAVTGARWQLPRPWAHTVFRGLLPVVPANVDPRGTAGVHARFDVRPRGDPGARVVIAVDDGTASVRTAGREPVDCHVDADPAALLLVLYGRTGPLAPALRGRILAWGRRPWLGLALPRYFRRP